MNSRSQQLIIEAVPVLTSWEHFEEGKVWLVCWRGGGGERVKELAILIKYVTLITTSLISSFGPTQNHETL